MEDTGVKNSHSIANFEVLAFYISWVRGWKEKCVHWQQREQKENRLPDKMLVSKICGRNAFIALAILS